MAHCGHYLDVVHTEPLVALNTFVGVPQSLRAPPTHAQVRGRLPALWGSPWCSPGTAFPGRPSASPTPSLAAQQQRHQALASAAFDRVFEMLFGNLKAATPANDFAGPYADAAFNSCLFMWDSVFMAVFWKYALRAHDFQGTLDTFYRKQLQDGFISREIRESDGRAQFHRFDPHSTGPNVLAWCEWEYFQLTGDRARLQAVFPPLLAYHKWMQTNRSWPDGSYFSCGYACGMDNQPRVQEGESVTASHSFTAWVDATSQALLSATSLLSMAHALSSTAAPTPAPAPAPSSASHHAFSAPALVLLRSCAGSSRPALSVAREGADGLCREGTPGTPCALLPVSAGCVEVRLHPGPGLGNPFLDLKFGRAQASNPVWAYARNGTASQFWKPQVVPCPQGQHLRTLLPLCGGVAGGQPPSSPASASALTPSALLFRSAVNPGFVLAANASGGSAVCVQPFDPSLPPGHLWTLEGVSSQELTASHVASLAAPSSAAMGALREEQRLLQCYLRDRMWCEAQGCFADVRLRAGSAEGQGSKSSTRSVGAYWTLVAGLGGKMGEAQLHRFLGALDDPTLFNRPTRVPSLAADHPHYDKGGGYWLGSSWPPTTYVRALLQLVLCVVFCCRRFRGWEANTFLLLLGALYPSPPHPFILLSSPNPFAADGAAGAQLRG